MPMNVVNMEICGHTDMSCSSPCHSLYDSDSLCVCVCVCVVIGICHAVLHVTHYMIVIVCVCVCVCVCVVIRICHAVHHVTI